MVEPKKINGLHNIPTTAGFAGPGGGFEGGAAAGFEIDDASKHKKADEREVEKSLEDTDAFDAIDVNAIRARSKASGTNETVMSKITSTGVGDSSLSSLVAQAEGEAAADVRDSLYVTQQMPAMPAALSGITPQEPPRATQSPIR
ncbi:hypothetical protein HMPREF1580_01084, partial [Gardnerella vaginalis JCP8070]